MEQFKVGDVVWLKSGGPAMTVWDPATTEGMVSCRWFAPGHDLEKEKFLPEELRLSQPDIQK